MQTFRETAFLLSACGTSFVFPPTGIENLECQEHCCFEIVHRSQRGLHFGFRRPFLRKGGLGSGPRTGAASTNTNCDNVYSGSMAGFGGVLMGIGKISRS